MRLHTVGHGTLAQDDFLRLLQDARIGCVVDVRIAPGSRRHPHFRREALSDSLSGAGMAYVWEKDLGGHRKPHPDSPHMALRNAGFRAYADHMATAAFGAALARVLERARTQSLALLCAESVWWRCHRKMIADAAVLLHEVPVHHLFHDGRLDAHTPAPEARVADGRIVYDVDPDTPLLNEHRHGPVGQ